ncbi:iron uptake transporter permease EfeU [Microbacterium marinilacus]|uniref:iron uptake transporter permease EfeU n=1 Tax=Microbacterium marinilacus TaxID=415209 RepID=UPI001C8E273E|nr:iron uptake transporter permease EfeU [Microbacterium marinilacus]MBY0689892.1 FTR1 family protein [Microbacterium marinilacus]
MFPTFLIGLREGLEAALVVGILVAYLVRSGRRDVVPRLLAGVLLAILLAVAVGAVMTFGAYTLSFEAQELIGGGLSLLAVGMVTWMVFWMQRAARSMKADLERSAERALLSGSLWSIVAIGFVSVAREGIETTLLLWSMVRSFGNAPEALIGAVLGIVAAALLGWLLQRGFVRLDLRRFFAWTGAALVVVAAGVLAYGVHDLQEAGALPGPFGALAPVDPVTGAVAVGVGGVPFGYAFDVSAAIAPGGPLAAVLQATIGFTPQMTWLQVLAWGAYLLIVGGLYVRRVRQRPARVPASAVPDPSEQGAS